MYQIVGIVTAVVALMEAHLQQLLKNLEDGKLFGQLNHLFYFCFNLSVLIFYSKISSTSESENKNDDSDDSNTQSVRTKY